MTTKTLLKKAKKVADEVIEIGELEYILSTDLSDSKKVEAILQIERLGYYVTTHKGNRVVFVFVTI